MTVISVEVNDDVISRSVITVHAVNVLTCCRLYELKVGELKNEKSAQKWNSNDVGGSLHKSVIPEELSMKANKKTSYMYVNDSPANIRRIRSFIIKCVERLIEVITDLVVSNVKIE